MSDNKLVKNQSLRPVVKILETRDEVATKIDTLGKVYVLADEEEK